MLKKFGLVAVGVTASLVAVAPLANAIEPGSGDGDCSSESDDRGNTGQLNTCNVSFNDFGERNGEGNTFNGQPVENPFGGLTADDVPVN